MVLVTPYNKNKISITLQIFFLILHAILAMDFGFLKRNSVAAKISIKIFTLLQCAGICLLTLYDFTLPDNEKDLIFIGVWFLAVSSQYIYNCLILMFNYERSFFILIRTLFNIDDLLVVDSKVYNDDFIIIGTCCFAISVRIINTLMYCVYFEEECTRSPVVNSMIISHIVMADLIHLLTFLFLHTAYSRLKMLNKIIKNCGRRIPKYIYVYKSLVDIVEKVKGCFDYLYLMALFFKIPELIGTVYLALLNVKEGKNMYVDHQFVRSLYTAQVVVLLFLPALSAGFLTAEAKKLKLILYEMLILEKDEDRACFLELFMEYVSARPLKLKMVKVIPLDWTLPILVMDFIISYQIIIVQLTNLF